MQHAQVQRLSGKIWASGYSFWSPVVLNTKKLLVPISVLALTSKS